MPFPSPRRLRRRSVPRSGSDAEPLEAFSGPELAPLRRRGSAAAPGLGPRCGRRARRSGPNGTCRTPHRIPHAALPAAPLLDVRLGALHGVPVLEAVGDLHRDGGGTRRFRAAATSTRP